MNQFRRGSFRESENAPKIDVRYFYSSPLHIDDILAPVPSISTASNPSKLVPQPFSDHDSSALDKAWIELQQKLAKYRDLHAKDDTSTRNKRGLETPVVTTARNVVSREGVSKQAQDGSDTFLHTGLEPEGVGRRRGSSLQSESRVSEPVSRRSSRAAEIPLSESLKNSLDGSIEGTTGTPFIRAPSRSQVPRSHAQPSMAQTDVPHIEEATEESHRNAQKDTELEIPISRVVVGAARLHHVVLPDLQMEPIYWSPVHDVAETTRATWFYKDSMLPVEVDVANLLEAGYVALRPWTETWNDELDSAVTVGAAGEEKIVHPLWPKPQAKALGKTDDTVKASTLQESEEDTPERRIEATINSAKTVIAASTKGEDYDNRASGKVLYGRDGTTRRYSNASVLYANSKEAHILRPSLQPSSYYGRRPLANYVRKGYKIGVCVVRGFDLAAWDALHYKGRKKAPYPAYPENVHPSLKSPNSYLNQTPTSNGQEEISDLVLVVHGIGQKFSERLESFHFTHAMNAFRREVNVELSNPTVRTNLRKGMGGVMVLPVNWRHSLSFEEGGYREGPEDPALNSFALRDITPKSLPSVRNVISDILLDIPYYLSHHQPKMLAAVIREANRIYHLWCKNNPTFRKHGRIHLIAHSLGSVMVMDILSKQPTSVKDTLERNKTDLTDLDHFAFDTTNLFVCGSPAGFFLLLQKASLLPRKGQDKPSADGEDQMPGVASEQGRYGCIAVDNIYNIINPYDPVAYHLNATVDATYAASLKPAPVPSVAESWFSFGSRFRSRGDAAPPGSNRPVLTQRLPSNVELETHDFTHEEIAEKRMYLLNDNGQIDYLLRYGGGPFEIQYLTMLGAHSSYWLSQDFVRFVVVEAGRKPGRPGTINALGAVKKKAYTA